MGLIKIYIDEDAMDGDLVITLRSRGVTVVTPLEVERTGKLDEEQLAFATESGCVLYTHNISDFHRLHTAWLSAGREHAGMNPGPTKAVLGWRTVAANLAHAWHSKRREYEEPGRVSRELGLRGP